MTIYRKRKPPVFPKVLIKNFTASPLYLGFGGKNQRGIWLAANGQSGDSIVIEGLNLADKRILDTLKSLLNDKKIGIKIMEAFYVAVGANAGTTTTSW